MTNKSNLLSAFVILEMFTSFSSFSQVNFNDKTHSYGIRPASAEAWVAGTNYDKWTTDFVTSTNAGGFKRVKYPESDYLSYTISAAMGYGMLLAAYRGDQELFDNFFGFVNLHKNKRGLMSWYIPSNGVNPADGTGEYNSATDADEDIAWALFIANFQWGSTGNINYKNEAIKIIDSLYKYNVDTTTWILKPGDSFGDTDCINPSYFALSYYPFFAKLTLNDGWYEVRNKCIEILTSISNLNSSGLIGSWSDQFGGLPLSCAGHAEDYEYAAARIPWRVGLDYLWNGTPESKYICERIINWTLTPPINGDAGSIREAYYKNGVEKSSRINNTIISGFQTAAMASGSANWLDTLYVENLFREDTWYFNRALKLISLFIATGNFWPPPPIQQVLVSEVKEEKTFIIFPNPSRGEFTINGLNAEAEFCQLDIYNMLGESIFHKSKVPGECLMDLSDQPEGIYFAILKEKDKISIQKLIIQK